MKRIIHIDMDAFYASVEERDNPKLKGRPLVVGGNPNSRGVVATCNYEARKYGIHSAMSCKRAYALCPHVVFVGTRHEHYGKIAKHIRSIFKRYTQHIEPLSLDEAFLDVTHTTESLEDAVALAIEIKASIKNELDLSASAGVSYNKFLAKIASDYKKPNGLMLIRENEAQNLLDKLPIEKFFGVGKVTAKELKKIGVTTGRDLRRLDKKYLDLIFNKRGEMLYQFARGIDHREVEHTRVRKSIGAETTFDEDLYLSDLKVATCIRELAEEVITRMSKYQKKARTVTIKIKFEDFTQITRSITPNELIRNVEDVIKCTVEILNKIKEDKKIRLIGVTLSNLLEEEEEVYENVNLFELLE